MSRQGRLQHRGPSGNSKVKQAPAQGISTQDIVNRHQPGMPIGNPMATRMPRFMDIPSESYHEMLNKITDVQSSFRSLPARLKGKFQNDPYQMMRWIEKPENRAEALKLGLVVPTDEEAAQLATEARKARVTEQVDIIREALKPDPEANPINPHAGGSPAKP